MEDRQFDALTQKLAAPVSRRTVFRAAIASVAGGIGVMATLGKAQAQNKPTCHGAGTPCSPAGANNVCCTGYCVDMGTNLGDRCGCPNKVTPCVTTVGCPTGFSSCEVCPPTCTGGSVLNSGTCTCVCSGGATFCGGQCVPSCEDGMVFHQATCSCVCPSGKVFCNGANGGAGGCVPACVGGEILNQSTCSCACANGETFCGICTNLQTDPNNCGSCGTVCPNGGACLGGVCQCTEGLCGTSQTCCAAGTSCCGTGATATCCANTQVCCGTGATAACCAAGSICCGTGATATCCAAGSVCLTPPTKPGAKAAVHQAVGPTCCPAAKVCGSTCCTATQTCLGGKCCDNKQICEDVCCATGTACVNGACAATCTDPRTCANTYVPGTGGCATFTTGVSSGQCYCVPSAEGGSECVIGSGMCNVVANCTSSDQCPAGAICFTGTSGCCAGSVNPAATSTCRPRCCNADTDCAAGAMPDAICSNGACCPVDQTFVGSGPTGLCCPNEQVCGTGATATCGCTNGMVCTAGACACPANTFLCDGSCVSTGATSICGTGKTEVCCSGTSPVCTNGVCCPTGQFGCPGAPTAVSGCCPTGSTCISTAGGNVCMATTCAVEGTCADNNFGTCDAGCTQTFCVVGGAACTTGTCTAVNCQIDADCPNAGATTGVCTNGVCNTGVCTGAGCDTGTCGCYSTEEGGPICAADVSACGATCATSADCGANGVCIVESCCGTTGHCMTICSGSLKPSQKRYGKPVSRR